MERTFWPGPLDSLSLEQLLARAEMRKRAALLGIGDPDVHIIDCTAIAMELERRRDARLRLS